MDTPPTRRTAHITAALYPPGGKAHFTASIWRQLAVGARRHYVFARSATGKHSVHRDGKVVVILLGNAGRRDLAFVLGQFRLLGLLARVRPNLLLVQSPIFGGWVASIWRLATRTPLLIEFHGDHYFTSRRPSIRTQLIRIAAWPSVLIATRVRALGAGMKSDIVKDYGISPDKVAVLPIRVDTRIFAPQKRDYSLCNPPRVVIVGSVTPRKGQIRLVEHLRRTDWPSGLSVSVIGEGPDLSGLATLASQDARPPTIEMLGSLTHEMLVKELRRSDIYVQYSNSEGTPRAIAEAMAVGLPVISTNVGYISDLISHGVTGWVIQQGECIEEVVRALLVDGRLRSHLGKNAAAFVRRELDAEKVFARYRALLTSTIVGAEQRSARA